MQNARQGSTLRYNYVLGNSKILDGGLDYSSVAPKQIGFFDVSTQNVKSIGVNDISTAIEKLRLVYGKRTNPDKDLYLRSGIQNSNLEFPFDLPLRSLQKFTGTKPDKQRATSIVSLGFDGVDTNKRFHVKLGERRIFYVHLKGHPVDVLTNRDGQELTREYTIKGDCFPSGCFDATSEKAQEAVALDLLQQINNDKLHMGQVPISRLFRAGIIKSCTVDLPQNTKTYYKWQINIVDGGKDIDLSYIRSKYPSYVINRVARKGLVSTYETTLISTVTSIADYQTTAEAIISNCDVCPDGYTKQNGLKVFEVIAPANFSVATNIANVTEVTRVKMANAPNYDRYLIYFTKASVTATILAGLKTDDNLIVNDFGVSESICVANSTSTFTWTKGSVAYYSKPKNYVLSLVDNVCGTDRLSELQASYPDNVISIVSTGTCAKTYQMTVYSNLGEEGCSQSFYTWKPPMPFAGYMNWRTADTPVNSDATCAYGIILEGAIYSENYNANDPNLFPYYFHDPKLRYPVTISISSKSAISTDIPCEIETPVTVLSEPKTDFLYGWHVFTRELESYYLLSGLPYQGLPNYRLAHNQEMATKLDSYYCLYSLTFNLEGKVINLNSELSYSRVEINIFVEEGKHKELETYLNKLVSNANANLKEVVL